VKRALLLLAITCGLCLLALAWLVIVYPSQRPPLRDVSKTVAIDLDARSSLEDVAARFSSERLITQPRLFALYARVLGAGSRLRSGRVLVTAQMSARQLLQRVATGYGTTPLRITIPEGFNRFDIAARLAEWGVCSQADFLRSVADAEPVKDMAADADSREGYLFPDTYWLHDDMPAEQVVARFTSNAKRRLTQLEDNQSGRFVRLQTDYGLGLREVVILASIVEKEAHFPSEQPIIAGVFLNRLIDERFRPKRLQADPTVAYGCLLAKSLPSCQGFDGKRITRAMIADAQNPYNTYRIEGLPPGPIANPGLSALRAVLLPTVHDYFYFVARGDGHHAFSKDLAAHNLAVQHADLGAAEGP
jgi:UPF0755 protein